MHEFNNKKKQLGKVNKVKVASIVISVVVISIFTFITVFSFAYKAYSESDKAAEKTAEKAKVRPIINEQVKGKESAPYLVNGEIPTEPFKGAIKGDPSFIFKNSSNVKLSYSDVLSKTLDELFVARNEIFARNGHIFTTNKKLDSYFRTKAWYKPNESNLTDTKNDVEVSNADIIKQVEVTRISKYSYGNKAVTGFVITDSDTAIITKEQLKELKDWQLILARNEIFARHGMTFGIPQLSDHFKLQSWYKPVTDFDATSLTEVELNNIETLNNEENIRYSIMLKR